MADVWFRTDEAGSVEGLLTDDNLDALAADTAVTPPATGTDAVGTATVEPVEAASSDTTAMASAPAPAMAEPAPEPVATAEPVIEIIGVQPLPQDPLTV